MQAYTSQKALLYAFYQQVGGVPEINVMAMEPLGDLPQSFRCTLLCPKVIAHANVFQEDVIIGVAPSKKGAEQVACRCAIAALLASGVTLPMDFPPPG
jgi:hypothetical protein